MPLVIDDAIMLLMMAAAKAAMKEALFWSQNKNRAEIEARAKEEEDRTDLLFADGNMDGG